MDYGSMIYAAVRLAIFGSGGDVAAMNFVVHKYAAFVVGFTVWVMVNISRSDFAKVTN
jgi:hypothetical protein